MTMETSRTPGTLRRNVEVEQVQIVPRIDANPSASALCAAARIRASRIEPGAAPGPRIGSCRARCDGAVAGTRSICAMSVQ